MIARESITIKISGEKFSPSEAKRQTGLNLTDTLEPGEIPTRGKHKGHPSPYGYANLAVLDQDPDERKLASLLDELLLHVEILRMLGAEDFVVYAGYFYKDQCNLTFWPDAMEKLGRLGVPFWVSCYEISDD